jgi:hypothetical protein
MMRALLLWWRARRHRKLLRSLGTAREHVRAVHRGE